MALLTSKGIEVRWSLAISAACSREVVGVTTLTAPYMSIAMICDVSRGLPERTPSAYMEGRGENCSCTAVLHCLLVPALHECHVSHEVEPEDPVQPWEILCFDDFEMEAVAATGVLLPDKKHVPNFPLCSTRPKLISWRCTAWTPSSSYYDIPSSRPCMERNRTIL